jgi:hypothetical protein
MARTRPPLGSIDSACWGGLRLNAETRRSRSQRGEQLLTLRSRPSPSHLRVLRVSALKRRLEQRLDWSGGGVAGLTPYFLAATAVATSQLNCTNLYSASSRIRS